jgi:hypothetical protein
MIIKYLEKHKTLNNTLLLIVTAGIIYASSIPYKGTGIITYNANYISILYHALAFYALALLTLTRTKGKHLWITILLLSTFAGIDELHQHYTEGRFPSIEDWITDTTGILLASLQYTKKKLATTFK